MMIHISTIARFIRFIVIQYILIFIGIFIQWALLPSLVGLRGTALVVHIFFSCDCVLFPSAIQVAWVLTCYSPWWQALRLDDLTLGVDRISADPITSIHKKVVDSTLLHTHNRARCRSPRTTVCYFPIVHTYPTTFCIVSVSFDFAREEEKIIQFWREIDAFQTSLKLSEGRPEFSFYDGPPFATGLPHYGHLLAGTIKVGAAIHNQTHDLQFN